MPVVLGQGMATQDLSPLRGKLLPGDVEVLYCKDKLPEEVLLEGAFALADVGNIISDPVAGTGVHMSRRLSCPQVEDRRRRRT